MSGSRLPPNTRAVKCLRCDAVLIVHDDIWLDPLARHEAMVEHHAWLCTNPTPGVAAARRNRAGGDQWP